MTDRLEQCDTDEAMNRVEFTLEEYEPDWGQWQGVVPIVDGVSLIDRIRDYETQCGFDLPGSYGGLQPYSDDIANWVRYLVGDSYPEGGQSSDGTTWLLGCNCSFAGCWPLEARVTVGDEIVTWNQFRQPHRPKQDYSSFGPFFFARNEYDQEVERLAALLASRSME